MSTGDNDAAEESATPIDPFHLAPADHFDPVIEAYKKDVDRTLLRENLRLSIDERLRKYTSFVQSLHAWRGSANASGRGKKEQ